MIERFLSISGVGVFRRVFVVIIILSFWEAAARAYGNPLLFPWPEHILTVSFPSISVFEGAKSPDTMISVAIILRNLTVTLQRQFSGLFIGLLLGIAFGLSMHYFQQSKRMNALLLTMLRSFPLFSLLPLFLFWFSGSASGIYIYISWAVFLVVATGVFDASFNIPKKLLIQSTLLGATRLQRFRTVVFHAIQPELAGTIRNVVGLSWAFALGAEYLSANEGLGYLVYLSYLYADMGKLIVFAFVYGFCGFMSYKILNLCSHYSKRWMA